MVTTGNLTPNFTLSKNIPEIIKKFYTLGMLL